MLAFLPIAIATIGLAGKPAPAASAERRGEATQHDVPIGIYDPEKRFKRKRYLAFEHVFIKWQDFDTYWLHKKVRYAAKRRRKMLITVEPWTKSPGDTGSALFKNIVNGGYDREITAICTELSKIRRRPLVRWGHEMEEVTGRYPWAREDSDGYVQAFRHFVSSCRAIAPKVRFVWSPLGHSQLAPYYPGDAYVNFIGLPIYSYQKADRKWFKRSRTFKEAVAEKYDRVTRFNKPVILAELGVSGTRRYERRWLRQMKNAGELFPRVKAMLYFNMREINDWPDGLGKPDWRIKPRQLR
ncbi:glycoside hydrolase family 26 protein [Microbaculum sp. FT89]|uniref:glycoside hydrolase family 26 protein n=1 Tax=Microbaculum sp. FT89 TaxID=3447298 RepID=UPI003F53D93B